MKLAFVVQRYGKEVIGGAETYCRLLAERLKDFFDVEVLTSCALDYITWDNYYKPGLECVNGVKVKRFATERNRDIQRFNDLNIRIITHEIKERHVLEKWMEEQGPYLPQLVEYIKQSGEDYDYFIFITYLYYQTYFGIRLFPGKSILIPLAHDEPPIYFDIFKDIFNLPKGIIYQTPEEKDFVNKMFDNSEICSEVIGIGIEESGILNQEDFLKKNNIDYPYLLYAGRIDASKGCDELFDFFLRYKFIFDSDLKLLLIGKEVLKIPEHRDIIFLGFLSEGDKYSAMSSALVNVIPSPYESISISALESFMSGRPILVNGKSEVLKGHCMRSGGGLYYCNYNDFAGHLNYFKDDPNSATVMGGRGRDYVLTRYNWKVIINNYLNFFNLLNQLGGMRDAKKNKEVEAGIKRIKADIQEKEKTDYNEDTKVEKELETREVDDLLVGDMDELNQELIRISEEWDVTQFDISRKEGGLKKLVAFIYRKFLSITLRPYAARFLLKQARFNFSVVRCLNQIGRLTNHVNELTNRVNELTNELKSLKAQEDLRFKRIEGWLKLIKAKIDINIEE